MLSYLYNVIAGLFGYTAATEPQKDTYDGFVYVVVKQKHKRTNYMTKGKYKVGRTNNGDRRAREYGKGSLQLAILPKKDQIASERQLLTWLKADKRFKLIEGRETFEGELEIILDYLVRC